MVLDVLESYPGPLLLDADALNVLRGQADTLRQAADRLVITPHPGEFVRLFDVPMAELLLDPCLHALDAADRFGAVVVLKGTTTLVAAPDGRLSFHTGGNPGMATGGSGDVLSGLVTSLLAQGLSPYDAACAGVFLHGAAGDRAAEKYGRAAMRAGDLIDCIVF